MHSATYRASDGSRFVRASNARSRVRISQRRARRRCPDNGNQIGLATRDPLLPHLADVLRELRQSRGRSQEAIAHEAELTVNAYGNIERGQADPGSPSLCVRITRRPEQRA
jgi:DNA-binding XRE family transcriptional regulator